MRVTIHIPFYLQQYMGGMEAVDANGKNVGECLNQLTERFPDMISKLFNKKGILHSYVSIYVNKEDAYPEELTKPVKDGDEIHLLYVIGGG